jgi:hypothetical protein
MPLGRLALPVCVDLVGTAWIKSRGLQALGQQAPLIEQLSLLLPLGGVNTKAVRQCLRPLRVQIGKASTMQDMH